MLSWSFAKLRGTKVNKLATELRDKPELMSKQISIFGLGYVGSVTAACLASKGHSVIGVDTSAFKVEQLDAGRSPIVEPGMKELVERAHHAGQLRATTDSSAAVM